ncbi:leucine-rich repeat domain-containing protein [Anaerotignum lactatifermentans]|uniref:non-specific serine/threonine protein kinase n=1 Tax=Anaerotignum lactatifermentans TaxID=160404 RepID=A0ABS2GB74_9FIRM|nr:leucine-rich repeat domain-containing protein [Anaerotignum lactatifermentans]MBM6830052.1 leucine-rich repeat domain-containing protein [Anaerotignum lactatifermentans]MBM6878295.1 leucine-rich repeat domain-containing protein [Anaerotignum lactatifermentans]MBM6951450.1 leucine-rich repeat domain-containing protein [Anaerotignum lactatifermentans]
MEIREQFLREYQEQVLDKLALPPGLREQYSLQACLKDGERQVYLVQDQAGWPAVLKLQPTGREDTLRQEYDLLRGLRHPQLPQPIAYLEWEGKEYLIREYMEGVSLYEQVTAQGPLSPDKVRTAALSLCQVLNYLHSQKPPVICRDVKPQNVVMDPTGRCHLIDLGAARCFRPEQQGDTVFLGTEVTAPPEQFGYQQTDQRSDIYSLGVLMRFLLTGSFESSKQDIEPNYLCRVIRRCTAFDPKNRYGSVRAVYRALKYPRLDLMAGIAGGILFAVILLLLLWSSAGEAQVHSSLLEDALRQELRLEEDEPIPIERLGEVEQLLVCGEKLMSTLQEHEEQAGFAHDRYLVETPHGDINDSDLEILAQCVNLRILILDYQQISDISPLAELPLEYLSLTGNQISDLRPLAGQTELRVLDLGENPVRSVEVLSQLTALREVILEASGITSLKELEGSSIQSLNVRGTWVTDFSPLESCPNLTCLIIGELPSGAAETLAGLTGLMELRLYSTQNVDLFYFTGFQKLQDLDLYGCILLHPEALTSLPSLRLLNLGETGINDLSFLPEMPAMTDVDLRNDPLTDLTPLLDCPWLRRLTLSLQHQPMAQEQLEQAIFEIVFE